jgi:hypothetical protein
VNRNTFYSARRVAELTEEPLNKIANICRDLQVTKSSSGDYVIGQKEFAKICSHIKTELTAKVASIQKEILQVESAVAKEGGAAVREMIKTVRLGHAAGLSGQAAQALRQLDNILDGARLIYPAAPMDRKEISGMIAIGKFSQAARLHRQLSEAL